MSETPLHALVARVVRRLDDWKDAEERYRSPRSDGRAWADLPKSIGAEFIRNQIASAQEELRSMRDELAALLLTAGPQETWRCFHCEEVFTDKAEAREHFGSDEWKTPACRLSADSVKKLRELENANTELRRENDRVDNDARLWHESEADRVRRIGHCQWWQHVDSLEGEKLVLQEQVQQLTALGPQETPAGWQPIETAPNDGTPILACKPSWTHPYVFCYLNGPRLLEGWHDFNISASGRRPHELTHWMPLPAPPPCGTPCETEGER